MRLAVLGALACARPPATPEATYRAFAHAVAERDAEAAYALLSSDTRAWLEARARALAAAAPGIVPGSAEKLLIGDAALAARPLARVVVVRATPDDAVLRVTEQGGRVGEVELVREKGWRVRLPPPGPGGP
ncbi:MAG TPA: hypothetical protein VMG32_09995 [Anaeromyxobacteraceae bacterium]|nr:hypothetical protein [Anaeromyxobacteraceae bacterium]